MVYSVLYIENVDYCAQYGPWNGMYIMHERVLKADGTRIEAD